MNNFTQRVDERSAINPSGFTGVIVQNSNAVIDKSFIEKGTSFVNALENSNVVLKDCGTPNPTLAEETTVAKRLKANLKLEIDRATLPPWVYYKLSKTKSYTEIPNIFPKNRSETFELEYINDYDLSQLPANLSSSLASFRSELLNSLSVNADNGKLYNKESLSIENQALSKGVATKDIDYTIMGQSMYWLDGVESAIKAVWPLDAVHQLDIDNPKLNLHFKDRLTFPLKDENSGEIIYITNVYKEDELGRKIVENNGRTVYEFSPITHKHVMKASMNIVNRTSDNQKLTGSRFKLNQFDDEYFFDGPYYSTNEVAYYTNDKNNGKVLQNDFEKTDFYFKLNGVIYSLFDVINKKSTVPDNVYTILNEDFDFEGRLKTVTNEFEFDIVTVSPDLWNSNRDGVTYIAGMLNNKINNSSAASIILGNKNSDESQITNVLNSIVDVNALENYPFYKTAVTTNTFYLKDGWKNGYLLANDQEISSFIELVDSDFKYAVNDGDNNTAKIKINYYKADSTASKTTKITIPFNNVKITKSEGADPEPATLRDFLEVDANSIAFKINYENGLSVKADTEVSSVIIFKENTGISDTLYNSEHQVIPSGHFSHIKYDLSHVNIYKNTSIESVISGDDRFEVNASDCTTYNAGAAENETLRGIFGLDENDQLTLQEGYGDDERETLNGLMQASDFYSTSLLSKINESNLLSAYRDNNDKVAYEDLNNNACGDYAVLSASSTQRFISSTILNYNKNTILVRHANLSSVNNWWKYDNNTIAHFTSTQKNRIFGVTASYQNKDYTTLYRANNTAGEENLSAFLFNEAYLLNEWETLKNTPYFTACFEDDVLDDDEEGNINDFFTNAIQEDGYLSEDKITDIVEHNGWVRRNKVEETLEILTNINKRFDYIVVDFLDYDPVNGTVSDVARYFAYRIQPDDIVVEDDGTLTFYGNRSTVLPFTLDDINNQKNFKYAEIKKSDIIVDEPSAYFKMQDGFGLTMKPSAEIDDYISEVSNYVVGLINNSDNTIKELSTAFIEYVITSSLHGDNDVIEENLRSVHFESEASALEDLSGMIANEYLNAHPVNREFTSYIAIDYDTITATAEGLKVPIKVHFNDIPNSALSGIKFDDHIEFENLEDNNWYKASDGSFVKYRLNERMLLASLTTTNNAYDTLTKFYKFKEDTLVQGLSSVSLNNGYVTIVFNYESNDIAQADLSAKIFFDNLFEEKSLVSNTLDMVKNQNGVFYNITSTNGSLYTIHDALKFNDEDKVSLASDTTLSSIYYLGTLLTRDSFSSPRSYINVNYDFNPVDQSKKVTLENYKSANFQNIYFYYDKNTKIPIELKDEYDGAVQILYDHTSNGMKTMDDATHDWKYLKDYEKLTTEMYVNENFIDWYNADIYVNYSNINKETSSKSFKFKLKLNNTPVNYEADFGDNYMVVTKEKDDNACIYLESDASDPDNNFKSLFNKNGEDENVKSQLKMLSFNFCIPKSGWFELDEDMYAENSNYAKPVVYDSTASIPELENIQTSNLFDVYEFEGKFIARYKLFNPEISRTFDYENPNDVYLTNLYSTSFIAKVKPLTPITELLGDGTDNESESEGDNEGEGEGEEPPNGGETSITYKRKRLDVFCENETLNFSANLKEDDAGVYKGVYTLKGMILTFKDHKGSLHHIQFPHIKIYCMYNEQTHQLMMVFKTQNCNENGIEAIGSTAPSTYYLNYDLMKNGKLNHDMIGNNLTPEEAELLTNYVADLNAKYTALSTVISAKDLKKHQEFLAKYGQTLSAGVVTLQGQSVEQGITVNTAKTELETSLGIRINEFSVGLSGAIKRKAAVEGNCDEQWGPYLPILQSDEVSGGFIRILLYDIAHAKGFYKLQDYNRGIAMNHVYRLYAANSSEAKSWEIYRDQVRSESSVDVSNTSQDRQDLINKIKNYFGSDGKVINGKKYTISSIYERHHCLNGALKHDAFMVFLSSESAAQKSVFKPTTFNSINAFELGNILPQIEVDKYTGYFNNWMTINDIAFTTKDTEVLETNDIVASSVLSSITDAGSTSSMVIDLERYVRPFDTSTNLLYYKAGDNPTASGIQPEDEVLIVNARKMYNSMDDSDEKPKDGALSLNLSTLFDEEMTLTGKISLNDNPFEEIYPYVNSKFEYVFSTNKEDDDLINDGYKRVKYTDYRAKAPQWRLHKLKSNMLTLTTVDGFKTTFAPIAPSDSLTIDKNNIEVPCKLSIKFDDLIFKQKVRSGIRFDDVTDVNYKHRIYNNVLLAADGEISEELAERFGVERFNTEEVALEFPFDSTGNDVDSYVLPSGYFTIKSDPTDNDPSKRFGGENYYNDIAKMDTITNAANRWETVYSRDKYANLEVFSDYCPGDHCVGTPYLNMATKVAVYEEYKSGTAGGGEGIISGGEASIGEVVKIATDIDGFNNIKTVETVEALPDYTDNNDVQEIKCAITAIESGDFSYTLTAHISGFVNDPSLIGKLSVDVEVPDVIANTFKNGETLKSKDYQNSLYVYFDGLLYEKDIYLNNIENMFETDNKSYMIDNIVSSTVSLDYHNVGLTGYYLSGDVVLQATAIDVNANAVLELHNVKPVSPRITDIQIAYTDEEKENLDKYGFLAIDNNIWQNRVKFNGDGFIKYTDEKEQPIFTIESYPIQSWVKEVYNDNNELTDLIVTVKIKGLKKFKESNFGTSYYFYNPEQVVLSSKELVDDYNMIKDMTLENEEYDNKAYWNEVFPEYSPDATYGMTVTSGILRWKTNDVNVEPLESKIENAGIYEYKYNPIGRDEFQIEVISKKKNEGFNKEIYFTNFKTDRWYNLSIYNLLINPLVNSTLSSTKGMYITDITGERLEDVTSKQTDIVNCYVSNDKVIEGNQIYSSITNIDSLNDLISSNHLHNYKTLYDIEFDHCGRTPFTMNYTDDPKFIQYLDEEITDTQYEKQYRKKKDLWRFNDSFKDLDFENETASIKLFANKEVSEDLNELVNKDGNPDSTAFIDYSDKSADYSSINNCPIYALTNVEKEDVQQIHKILNRYIPRKVFFGNDADDYILREKDMTYHMSAVPGLKAKSVMWINTPNLYTANVASSYYDTNVGGLSAVYDSFEYFSNPQHKLPCVNYKQKILSSDYATLVYNSCNTYNAVKSDAILNYNDTTAIFDYDKNPKIIAYVWDNAKVSRNETYNSKNEMRAQKLCWVKSSYNEYIAEVGSIYNYQDMQDYVNVVKIETGAITERQVVMQPVISNPLTFEKRSAEEGIVKVNDKIIATAALGYNNTGYPVNSVMLFNPENSNNDVQIDTTQTTYIYIAQSDQSSNCVVGGTQEKPVYVDMISQNIASNNERFTFLPNPSNPKGDPEERDTIYRKMYQGTYYGIGVTTYDKKLLKFGYSENFNELLASYEDRTFERTDGTQIDVESLVAAESVGKNAAILGAHTIFDYDSNLVERCDGQDQLVMFYNNALAANTMKGSDLDFDNVANVFYDGDEGETLAANINMKWKTLNCFGFDGTLIRADNDSRQIDYTQMLDNESPYMINKFDFMFTDPENAMIDDIEPSIAVVWLNDAAKQAYYSDFIKNIQKDINDERTSIFDAYYSANLTSVKFTIKSENIKNAPIYIKISFLNAEKSESSNKMNFVWKHDDIYDVDLRDTYKDEFDMVGSQKEIIKDFILQPGGNNIIQHVFGIKFTIMQIMPQNDEYNKAIIDNIVVYASNVLNKYGQSLSVEDVYVRKADANCRNHYKMDVAEYVWRLPSRTSEWKTLQDTFERDNAGENKYVTEDEYENLLESSLPKLAQNEYDNIPVSTYIGSDDKFSFLNSYFITSNNGSDSIKEVLSDSYISDSNMKVTWKYVDYVYIYYSCYSQNARQLIEKKFGDKIYAAVKAKLNANIKNMNANSAFKDRFTFKGGIAVAKSELLDENQHTDVFNWNTQHYIKTDYTDVYTTIEKWGTTTQNAVYEVTTYTDQYRNKKFNGTVGVRTSLQNATTTENWHTKETTKGERIDNQEDHYGATISNGKYYDVDKWTKSFAPIMIKYQID